MGTLDVASGLLAGLHAGSEQAKVDRTLVSRAKATASIPLNRIKPRVGGDTRVPMAAHVLGLAESIAALGLLEPLVVDSRERLIAGRNRLEALKLLAISDEKERVAHYAGLARGAPADDEVARVRAVTVPEWSGEPVPVRVLPIDAKQDPAVALAAEVAENEHRRDYTRDEVRALAARLRSAGFTDRRGRPRRGERPLRPALAAIVGKHERTIRRFLAEPQRESPSDERNRLASSIRAVRRSATSFLGLLEELKGGGDLEACREIAALLQAVERMAPRALNEARRS